MTQLNLLIHQHLKYIEENQRRVTPTELRSIRDNTPSKISMWWHFSTCSTKAMSSSCQRLDIQTKWDERMISTIVFSIGWSIILLAGAMSLRTKSKRWLKRVFWLWSQNIKGPLLNPYLEREYRDSQFYFQKPWVLSHQRLKQWDSSQSKAKGKSCNVSHSRWHCTSNSS